MEEDTSRPPGHTVSVQEMDTDLERGAGIQRRVCSFSTGLTETDGMDRLERTRSWLSCEADLPLLINVMWYFAFHNEARVLLFQS